MVAFPPCSVARAVSLVGDAWTVLILRELYFGARRFGAIEARVQAPRAIVAERLSHLVSNDLLARQQYQDRPPRFEYRLTERARDLYPAIVLLMQWGDRWLCSDRPPPLALTHKSCGSALRAEMACSACGGELEPKQVIASRTGKQEPDAPPGERKPRKLGERAVLERGRPCSVARAVGEVGDRWTLLVLREAFFGARRFDEFQVGSGAATNIVADRLGALVATGVLDRRPYLERPLRHEYRLTEKGRDLYGASLALLAWGDRWLAGDGGYPVTLTHAECGGAFSPVTVCAHCKQQLKAEDVTYETRYAAVATSAAA